MLGVDAKHLWCIARCEICLAGRREHAASIVLPSPSGSVRTPLRFVLEVDAEHLRSITRCEIYLAFRREHASSIEFVVTVQLWSEQFRASLRFVLRGRCKAPATHFKVRNISCRSPRARRQHCICRHRPALVRASLRLCFGVDAKHPRCFARCEVNLPFAASTPLAQYLF